MWKVLRSRNGASLWVGRANVFLGDQLHELILAWLVWDITKSSTATGLVLFVSHLPYWLLGWMAGVAADRWPPGLVILYANAFRALVSVAILALWQVDSLSIVLLAAFSFAINACATLDAPAFHAQIPQLVAPQALQSTIVSSRCGETHPQYGAFPLAFSWCSSRCSCRQEANC